MSYAIIQLSGQQYKVSQGDQLTVPLLSQEPGAKIEVTDVLMTNDGKKSTIGTPLVSKAKVTLEVLSHQKQPKIRVATYRSKSRYRRVKGHRTATTTVKVTTIA